MGFPHRRRTRRTSASAGQSLPQGILTSHTGAGTWEMGKVKGEGPQPGPSAMEQYRQHANLCPSVRKIFKIYYMTQWKRSRKKICIHSDYLYCLLNARIKRDQTMSEIIKCTNYIIFTKIKKFKQHSNIYILTRLCLFMNE